MAVTAETIYMLIVLAWFVAVGVCLAITFRRSPWSNAKPPVRNPPEPK